jgi:hypothetical protein
LPQLGDVEEWLTETPNDGYAKATGMQRESRNDR